MKRRTHAELLERARAELHTNPTIRVYEFAYGEEWPRPANPWLALNTTMATMCEAALRTAESMRATLGAMAAETAIPTVIWPSDGDRR